LVIIFLIQLIFPKIIRSIIVWVLLVLETILFYQYIWFFIEPRIEMTPLIKNIISFLTVTQIKAGELTTENLILVILYFFYVQYQNYNSDIYKKYDNKKYSFKNYFNKKFPKTTKIMTLVMQGVYIWLILSMLFLCIIFKEINVLFLFAMILYFCVMYKFLYSLSGNLLLCWILIIYCGLNTTIVYFYQFTSLDLIKPSFDKFLSSLPNIMKDNLNILGFTLYKKEDLPLKFLPHYGSNLLTVMLLSEVKRLNILFELDKENQNDENTKNDSSARLSKFSKISLTPTTSENLAKQEDHVSLIKYYSYYLVFILSKAYWFFIFYLLFILSYNYQLSVAMLTYVVTFLLGYRKLFKNYLDNVERTENRFSKDGRKLFFLIKLLRYNLTELNLHAKMLKKVKKTLFKILTIFTFIFMTLTYIFSILEMWKYQTKELLDNLDIIKIEGVCYLLGVYKAKDEDLSHSILPHLIFLILIILDRYNIYMQKNLKNEIDRMTTLMKDLKKAELEKSVSRLISSSGIGGIELRNKNLKNMKLSLDSINLNFGEFKNIRRLTSKDSNDTIIDFKNKKYPLGNNMLILENLSDDDKEKTLQKTKLQESGIPTEAERRLSNSFDNFAIRKNSLSLENIDELTGEEITFKNKFHDFALNDKKFLAQSENYLHVNNRNSLNNVDNTHVLQNVDQSINTINNLQNVGEENLNNTIYLDPHLAGSQVNNLETENIQDPSDRRQVLYKNSSENLISDPYHHTDPMISKFLSIFKNYKLSQVPNTPQQFIYSNKLKNRNDKLEVYFSMKRLLEEFIILFILISAIVKLNIFSVIYILIIFIFQIKNKTPKNIFILAMVLSVFLIIQYCLLISNLNSQTDPINNKSVLIDILEKYFSIPWFKKIDFFSENDNLKWAFYFSLGVEKYNFRMLGYDFVILMICFVYLENFSYLIFQSNDIDSTTKDIVPEFRNLVNINYLRRKKTLNDIFNSITPEKYDEIKNNLKFNFDIEIPQYDDVVKSRSRTFSITQNYLHKSSTLNVELNKKISEFLKKQNRKSRFHNFFLNVKSAFYLNIHNITLILIIILSMMNDGLITVFYLFFSFHYLNHSKEIILGEKSTYPKRMRKIFIYIIFIDLLIQILFQIPATLDINKDHTAQIVLSCIGLKNAVIKYVPLIIDELSISTLILKALIYFLCSLQILIYSSKDFKEFYTAYVFEKRDKTYVSAAMNAGLFNNRRIEIMQKSMDYRSEINKVLQTLEEHLKKWDEKLNGNVEIFDNRGTNAYREFSKKMDQLSAYNHEVDTDALQEKEMTTQENLKKSDVTEKHDKKSEGSSPKSINIVNTHENFNNRRVDDKMYGIEKKSDLFQETVRKICLSSNLVKFALFMNKISTSYLFVSKKEKEELENSIIKGYTHIPCRIRKLINKFIDEFTINDFLKVKEIKKLKDKKNNKDKKSKFDKNSTGHFKIDDFGYDDESIQNLNIEGPLYEEEDIIKIIQTEENKELIQDHLADTHLPNSVLLKFIFKKIIQYLTVNFHYICYFFMFLNHIMNASLVSLFWPMVVFLWALLEYPRPTRMFWSVSLKYAIIITICKFIIQLSIVLLVIGVDITKRNEYRHNDKLNIGIKIFPSAYSREFINYVIWDCLLILLILFEQYILVRYGLWTHTEREIEEVEEAYDRIAKANSSNEDAKIAEYNKLINKSIELHRIIETAKSEDLKNMKKNLVSENSSRDEYFYQRLFPKVRVSR
jgi:hypothetical protein